tara:strand:- start:1457 stop:1750 length:294 start_codon:yes stop_codon:yes gene_type:complete
MFESKASETVSYHADSLFAGVPAFQSGSMDGILTDESLANPFLLRNTICRLSNLELRLNARVNFARHIDPLKVWQSICWLADRCLVDLQKCLPEGTS